MMWIGKLIGAVVGYMLGGVLGALIGLGLGHWADRRLSVTRIGLGNVRQIRETFFSATFSVMGHVCKADGRVSEAEIAAAEAVMRHMNLSAEQRREAIGHFQAGKRADFDLDTALDAFRRASHGQSLLIRMFLEIQIQAALADGQVDEAEREALLYIARRLGLSDSDYARLEAFLRSGAQRAGGTSGGPSLDDAYAELGVSREASDAEVKRAYRKLMSQHHPDKLVSRGLPESMIKVAQERTQAIQAAYEAVKKSRGMT